MGFIYAISEEGQQVLLNSDVITQVRRVQEGDVHFIVVHFDKGNIIRIQPSDESARLWSDFVNALPHWAQVQVKAFKEKEKQSTS